MAGQGENDSAISRSASRSRLSGTVWRNCHKITNPLLISTSESRPKPISAIDPATTPAVTATTASIRL
jgi:hypothetical protein